MYVGDPAHGVPPLNERLTSLYQDIHHLAPNARILVLGYPRLFPATGDNSCGLPPFFRYLDAGDIRWLNKMATEVDGYLADAVAASGVAEYVSTLDAMTDAAGQDHSACGDHDPWINELQLFHPFAFPYTSESFHPNPSGYVAFEQAMRSALALPPPGVLQQLALGQTLVHAINVLRGTGLLTVAVGWPGSDVTTSVVSPSGRVIDRGTVAPDVRHVVGPTYEVYTVRNPQAGSWSVRSVGTSVAAAGEGVRVAIQLRPRRAIPPLAHATARPARGRPPLRVVLSARGSRALEGRIKAYRWRFGDGRHGTGRRVRHVYRRYGDHRAELTVVGTTGASTLASVAVHVGPRVAVKPSRLIDLGSARIGRHARRARIEITNTSRIRFRISRLARVRGRRRDLRVSRDRCSGRVLRHGRTCGFIVTIVPHAAGLRGVEIAVAARRETVARIALVAEGRRG